MTEERRLAAIMFSDVCGFSRIMGADEQRALSIIEMALSSIEQGASVYGGRMIKKMGDGALCEFPSAVNAVRAALAVQKAVSEHNATAPADEQFQMRIGIHVGDVVVSGGDILGDGVNVASRIEPLAEPGGICISRDVFDLVKNKVLIETVNLGPHDLKNISRQVDIYKVLLDAVASLPPTATPPVPHNGSVRRRRRRIAGFVILTILLLAGIGILKRKAGQNRAARMFESVTAADRTSLDSGNPQAAMKALDTFPARFAGTEWQTRIDEMKERIRQRMAREDIASRQEAFFKAIEANNREAALALIDPEILRTVDGSAIWLRARMAAGILKHSDQSHETDPYRITSVTLDETGIRAHVNLEVRRRKLGQEEPVWEPVPPLEWRLLNDSWYLHPSAKRPGDDTGPGINRNPSQPRRLRDKSSMGR